MSTYSIKLAAPKGHVVPPRLKTLAEWLRKQPHGSLGWFDVFGAFAIPKEWDEENAERLAKGGFAFLSLPDGSLLALLETAAGAPPAVVLLGSEGDRRTVANSFEELLALWSKGETEISELDGKEGAAGRKLLGKWLADQKVKPPKAKDFDFQAWLDGPAAASSIGPKAIVITRKPTATLAKLGPKAKKLAGLLGRRADDPDVVAYAKVLGKKLPASTSEQNDDAGLEAPKAGVQLGVTHDIHNDLYPPLHKTAKSFIPYLSNVWLDEKFGEQVLGVPWDVPGADQVAAILGKPSTVRSTGTPRMASLWTLTLDEGAEIELEFTFRKRLSVRIAVRSAAELEKYHRVTTGLFLGWAAENGLLDEDAFSAHAPLLAAVKKRKAQGTKLFDALGRGLWDSHLKDDAALRSFAYLWFHNMEGNWITADLKKVFGAREGPYGHDEPKLDDDTWATVDKAAPIFRERFAAFMK